MQGLDPGGDTRGRVVAHLREHGHDSISGIARALSSGRSRPIHRLTVAGYLEALTDVGILKQVDRPPSRSYQLQEPDLHRTLHQRVWRAVVQTSPEGQPRLLLAALQHLLQRPVFLAELVHAGAPGSAAALPRAVEDEVRRREYKKALARGMYRIEVPPRDPLMTLPDHELAEDGGKVAEVVRRVVLELTGAAALRAEKPTGAQASLQEAQ